MADIKKINEQLVEYCKKNADISDAEFAFCWETMDRYRCPPIDSVVNEIYKCIEDFLADNELEWLEDQLMSAEDIFYEL